MKKNGDVGLLESAARIGGMSIARHMHAIWGVDIVSILVKILLSEPVTVPHYQSIATARGAVAALGLLGADSKGKPWPVARKFNFDQVDWRALSGQAVNVYPEKMSMLPGTSIIQPYQPAKGALNFHGMLYLEADDATILVNSCRQTLDNMNSHLEDCTS